MNEREANDGSWNFKLNTLSKLYKWKTRPPPRSRPRYYDTFLEKINTCSINNIQNHKFALEISKRKKCICEISSYAIRISDSIGNKLVLTSFNHVR